MGVFAISAGFGLPGQRLKLGKLIFLGVLLQACSTPERLDSVPVPKTAMTLDPLAMVNSTGNS